MNSCVVINFPFISNFDFLSDCSAMTRFVLTKPEDNGISMFSGNNPDFKNEFLAVFIVIVDCNASIKHLM